MGIYKQYCLSSDTACSPAIVADDTKGNGPSRPPTDDADEIILDHLPIQAPHRHVDIPLAAAHEEGVCLRSGCDDLH